jgi:gas vesicle protein
VGKVTVDVQIDAKINGVQFKKGPMELNGWAAIQYARDRHNTAGGDVGRVGHQQQVMIALLKKLKDTNTVVTKIPELYTAFTENITTDLSVMQIAKLAFIAKDIDLSAIKQYTLTGDFLTVNSSSMIVASQSRKQEIVKEVFGIDVPIDGSWTKAKLQKEIEAKLSAGKDIVNTANNYLSNNAGYFTADEAAELQSAIATWRRYSQKNDPDNAADAAQDVQAQYDALKRIVDTRKDAIQKGRDSISWAQGKLSELSAYISDADKSTINNLIAAVQTCVDAKDYNGVGGPRQSLVDTATPIFNAAEAARGPAQTATPAPADVPSASAAT